MYTYLPSKKNGKEKDVQKKENKNKTFENVTYASWKPIERE